MESKAKTSYLSEHNFAPCPDTERTYSSNIAISADGKWMAYCAGNVVVLRSLEDLTTAKIFNEHKSKTSAVSFAPNNHLVASGDVEGNLKLWFIDDLSIKKDHKNVLSAKIIGIEWDLASEKLLVYGEGKKAFAKCISWDTANNVGEVSAHSKNILSGDMRKVRPIRIATGGEDFQVNFYEAYPCKLKKINKEHNNYVTGVRFSADGSHYVSVGFDKKIVVYDGKSGEVLFTLADDKTSNNHKMAIIGVCWLDNNTIGTCSLDKTVKVWDVSAKTLKYTLFPLENSGLDIPDTGCGIASNGVYLISLSLKGCLNFWEISSLADGKLPNKTIDGHQNYISDILHLPNKSFVISSDVNGKIIQWNPADNHYVITLSFSENFVVKTAASHDESCIYSLNNRGVIRAIDLTSCAEIFNLKLSGDPQKIVASRTETKVVYALYNRAVYIITDGKVSKELTGLSYEAKSLEVNEKNNEIYVGGSDGNIYVYDLTLKYISKHNFHLGEVSVIKLSNNGKYVASGDNVKYIYVWNSETKDIECDRFVFHSSKVFDIDWSADDTQLISGSLDKSVILWSFVNKSKSKIFSELDIEVIKSCKFINDSEFVCGGNSCAVRKFKF